MQHPLVEACSLPGNLTELKVMRTGSKSSLSGSLRVVVRGAPFVGHCFSLYPSGWHPRSGGYVNLAFPSRLPLHMLMRVYTGPDTCSHVHTQTHIRPRTEAFPNSDIPFHSISMSPLTPQFFPSSGPLSELLSSSLWANS